MPNVQQTEAVLAINGGEPVRKAPLPWELPGAHWIGDEELDLVVKVVKAKSLFRFYGLDSQEMVSKLEAAWCKRFNPQAQPGSFQWNLSLAHRPSCVQRRTLVMKCSCPATCG